MAAVPIKNLGRQQIAPLSLQMAVVMLTVVPAAHRGQDRARGLPLAVIVADYFHWTHLGDWKFDPAEWPDPAALTAELERMGIRLMVSVWPSVGPASENYAELERRGLFIGTETGPLAHATWPDKRIPAPVGVAFYDETNPEAREFIWSRVRDNYLRPDEAQLPIRA
jgi:alpha-D-xyloside xylohydrolase